MHLTSEDLAAILLTLHLASVTTVLLLFLATPIAWWLAHTQSGWRAPIAALVALPLVLPPTVLGFYLLIALGPLGPVGQFTQWAGWGSLAFSFSGLVLGSMVYSLPFAVQPLVNAFETMGSRPMEVAATLRANKLDAFFTVAVPMAKSGFVMAAMFGGNIPDKTRVVSTQIYGHVEAMEYAQAHGLAGAMLVFSFLVLLMLSWVNRRRARTVT
jgi:molybdate transport system permease protein